MPTLSNQTLLVYRLTCSLLIEAINNTVSFASRRIVVDGTRNFRSGSVIVFFFARNGLGQGPTPHTNEEQNNLSIPLSQQKAVCQARKVRCFFDLCSWFVRICSHWVSTPLTVSCRPLPWHGLLAVLTMALCFPYSKSCI